MVVRWDGGCVVNITTVDGQRREQVKSFKYFGSVITKDGRNYRDVKVRTAIAKDAFNNRKELLTKGLRRILRKRMIGEGASTGMLVDADCIQKKLGGDFSKVL